MANQNDTERYNVQCINCGGVWQPAVGSPLWWQAKQHAAEGYLDAIAVSGEKCGCIEKSCTSNARILVYGYDDMCQRFAYSFENFVEAVRIFRDLDRNGMNTVFIRGVSQVVENRLRHGQFA